MKKIFHYAVRFIRIFRLFLFQIVNRKTSMSIRKCDVSLETELRIIDDGRIIIQDHITTYGKTTLTTSGLLEIDSVSLNRYDIIACDKHIKIGKNCRFGPMVLVYDHDHLFDENGTKEGLSSGDVIIGNNVWIGANCVILKNTSIGNNCVIGAGCVVKGNIPDNSLVTMDRTLIVKPLTIKKMRHE